jgi:molybdopterin/thiamine biosynthesis adenylyltransferase
MGVGPGIIGTLQAAEAIKVILNHEGVLAGKLLQVSLKTQHFELFEY